MGERSACESNLPGRSPHRLKKRMPLKRHIIKKSRSRLQEQEKRYLLSVLSNSNEAAALSLLAFRHQTSAGGEATSSSTPGGSESDQVNLSEGLDWNPPSTNSAFNDDDDDDDDSHERQEHLQENLRFSDDRVTSSSSDLIEPVFKPHYRLQEGRSTLTPLVHPPTVLSRTQSLPVVSSTRCNKKCNYDHRFRGNLPPGKPLPPPPALAKHLIHMTKPIKLVLD